MFAKKEPKKKQPSSIPLVDTVKYTKEYAALLDKRSKEFEEKIEKNTEMVEKISTEYDKIVQENEMLKNEKLMCETTTAKLQKKIDAQTNEKSDFLWLIQKQNDEIDNLKETLFSRVENAERQMFINNQEKDAEIAKLKADNKALNKDLNFALDSIKILGDAMNQPKTGNNNNVKEFYHQILESEEKLENEKVKHVLFIRCSSQLSTDPRENLKKHFHNALDDFKANLIGKSIKKVSIINGKSSCLKVEMMPKSANDMLTILGDNIKLLEENGLFAKPFTTKETSLKKEILQKLSTKIKDSEYPHVSVPIFNLTANLMIKHASETEFKKMTYLEAMKNFGPFFASEEAFIRRIFYQMGGSHSNLKKSAIFLLPVVED